MSCEWCEYTIPSEHSSSFRSGESDQSDSLESDEPDSSSEEYSTTRPRNESSMRELLAAAIANFESDNHPRASDNQDDQRSTRARSKMETKGGAIGGSRSRVGASKGARQQRTTQKTRQSLGYCTSQIACYQGIQGFLPPFMADNWLGTRHQEPGTISFLTICHLTSNSFSFRYISYSIPFC